MKAIEDSSESVASVIVHTEESDEDADRGKSSPLSVSADLASPKSKNQSSDEENEAEEREGSDYSDGKRVIDEHICGICRSEFADLASFIAHKKECCGTAPTKPIVVVFPDNGIGSGTNGGSDNGTKISTKTPSMEADVHNQRQLQQQLMSVIQQLTSQLMTSQSGGQPVLPPATSLANLPIPMLMAPMVGQSLTENNHRRELHERSQSMSPERHKPLITTKSTPTISAASKSPMNMLQALIPGERRSGIEPISGTNNNTVSGSSSRDDVAASLPLPPPPVTEPAPSESETNILESLQRHTEQALQNTMSGSSFLVNGMSGIGGSDFLRFKKDGKEDPSFRHRCRYCGKVFGSDSALQIHIRSHTGERPFKCNICGNRFSTKGNLKVHFQRHRSKYPHIKMNPNPVPEHLDKFHPPLEPPSGSQSPNRSQSPVPPLPPNAYLNSAGNLGQLAIGSSTSFSHSIPSMIQTALDLKSKINQTKDRMAAAGHGNGTNHALGLLMSQMDMLCKSAGMDFSRHSSSRPIVSPSRTPSPADLSNTSVTSTGSSHRERKRKSSEVFDDKKVKHLDDGGDEESDVEDKNVCGEERNEKEEKNGRVIEKDRDLRKKRRSEKSSSVDTGADAEATSEKPTAGNHSSTGNQDELSDNDDPDNPDQQVNDDQGEAEDSDARGILERAAKRAAAELSRLQREEEDDDDDNTNDTGNNSLSRGLDGKSRDLDDDDDMADGHLHPRAGDKFPFLPPNFQSYFHHSAFPSSLAGMMPPFTFPPTMTTASISGSGGGNPQNGQGLTGDPILYQDLLPKPGSTDNSWESLMEIQKASETTKLQSLVDNIENKLTDPNQCIICHRILSCKSALQMHYRTHTGERPFKCKICGRAFTTKGNLKTHMGVHRVKPPLRILHQCPVCHKQFTNALVLQQHIRIHTGEPTDISPEHILANEVKSSIGIPSNPFHRHLMASGQFGPHPFSIPGMSHGHNPFFPNLQPTAEQIAMLTAHSRERESEISKNHEIDDGLEDGGSDTEDDNGIEDNSGRSIGRQSVALSDEVSGGRTSRTSEVSEAPVATTASPSKSENEQRSRSPSLSTSLAALENHVKTINSGPPPSALPFGPFSLGLHQLQYQRYIAVQEQNRQKIDGRVVMSPNSVTSKESVDGRASAGRSLDGRSTPGSREGEVANGNALDLTPRSASSLPGLALSTTSSDGIGKVQRPPGPNMSPGSQLGSQMFPPLFAGLPFPGRTSTTCRICLKTFACNSALEIHYRSHTKERPFKCDVCDRGFSTKGNMKQHMLTHKIRDLPASLYTTTTTSGRSMSGTRSIPSSAISGDSNGSNSSAAGPVTKVDSEAAETGSLPGNGSNATNGHRSSSPRRPSRAQSSSPRDGNRSHSNSSSSSRHVCSVCRKPFSSHSALQIHMRTHTGDKPFQCSICSRAFTTKGNLKVHMGTHMWNNGSSRRGRRMSIDLPNLHIAPPNGSDPFSSNNFFPMMNLGFMNGARPKPGSSGITIPQVGNLPLPQKMSVNTPNETSGRSGNESEDDDDHLSIKSEGSDLRSPDDGRDRSGSIEDNNSDRSSPNSWQMDCSFCGKGFSSTTELSEHIKSGCKEASLVMKKERNSSPSSVAT